MNQEFLEEISRYYEHKNNMKIIPISFRYYTIGYGNNYYYFIFYNNGYIKKEIISNSDYIKDVIAIINKYNINKLYENDNVKVRTYISNTITPKIYNLKQKDTNMIVESIVYAMDDDNIYYCDCNEPDSIFLESRCYTSIDYTNDNLNIIDEL